MINTGKVVGRRELRFESVDQILDDAESMAGQETKTLGNWSEGQIYKHLAISFERSVTGSSFKPPLPIRLLAPLMKKRFLTKTMKPGFKMPEKMKPDFMPPDEVSTEDGLAALRTNIEKYKNAEVLAPNSALGKMTREETDLLHMRHAEMHLSFIVPADSASS